MFVNIKNVVNLHTLIFEKLKTWVGVELLLLIDCLYKLDADTLMQIFLQSTKNILRNLFNILVFL